MGLTEIIFRVFAWARPLLWYYHRLRCLLSVAIHCLEDDDCCLWLLGDRFNEIEHPAQLRARRIKREVEAAPVVLIADHRRANPWPTLLSLSSFSLFSRQPSVHSRSRLSARRHRPASCRKSSPP
jgi:hypothetical protein